MSEVSNHQISFVKGLQSCSKSFRNGSVVCMQFLFFIFYFIGRRIAEQEIFMGLSQVSDSTVHTYVT